jgi:hypothetical protein
MSPRLDERKAMLDESMDALRKAAEQLRYSIEKCAPLSPPF